MKVTKLRKRRLFYSLFFMLILCSPLITYFSMASMGYASNKIDSPIPLENAYNPSISSNASRISSILSDPANGYNYTKPTSYQIDINLSVWNVRQLFAEGNLSLWEPLVKSQGSSQFAGTPQNQVVNLLERQTNGENSSFIHITDDNYNNSYDFYKAPFLAYHQDYFSFHYVYNVTLRETNWNIDPSNIGQYNKSDPLYINNTGAEPLLQVNSPILENLSYQICNASDINNIVDKAHAIYNWLAKNMTYKVQTANHYADKGALKAYKDGNGDCSEFSDLMVTLLRIQGIPARKVCGMVLATEEFNKTTQKNEWVLNLNHKAGESWEYNPINFPGHAWIQYYVPNYGWVSCDPTFGNAGYNYFDRIDNLHILGTIGETYGGGIDPSLGTSVNEFPILVPYSSVTNSLVGFLESYYTVKVTVLAPQNTISWVYIVIIIAVLISAFALIMYFAWYKRKKKQQKSLRPKEDSTRN